MRIISPLRSLPLARARLSSDSDASAYTFVSENNADEGNQSDYSPRSSVSSSADSPHQDHTKSDGSSLSTAVSQCSDDGNQNGLRTDSEGDSFTFEGTPKKPSPDMESAGPPSKRSHSDSSSEILARFLDRDDSPVGDHEEFQEIPDILVNCMEGNLLNVVNFGKALDVAIRTGSELVDIEESILPYLERGDVKVDIFSLLTLNAEDAHFAMSGMGLLVNAQSEVFSAFRNSVKKMMTDSSQDVLMYWKVPLTLATEEKEMTIFDSRAKEMVTGKFLNVQLQYPMRTASREASTHKSLQDFFNAYFKQATSPASFIQHFTWTDHRRSSDFTELPERIKKALIDACMLGFGFSEEVKSGNDYEMWQNYQKKYNEVTKVAKMAMRTARRAKLEHGMFFRR